MMPHAIEPDALPGSVVEIARRIAAHGGRAFVVGGWVRDRLLGLEPRDLDLEVHGLDERDLDAVLGELGRVHVVGRAFAIRRVRGIDADVSWVAPEPQRDANDPRFESAFARAAGRRDLTINAMGLDPLSTTLLDPAGGRDDLRARRLRAVDARRFGEDPLRALRVAQLAARLGMTPDEDLLRLCARQDMSGVAGERFMLEWTSLLTRAERPSTGLHWLERMHQVHVFPELDALRGVPQDPRWHPEGDVWTHTAMSLDAAARLRADATARDVRARPDATAPGQAEESSSTVHTEPLAFMFGVLCHDFGKPATTRTEPDATAPDGRRVRSIRHERAGLEPTRAFLGRMQAPVRLVAQVEVLVDRHLAPAQFAQQGAGDKAYRRLARRLDAAHASPALLEAVARADHLGRTTEDARLGRFPAGDAFLARVEALGLAEGAAPAVVQGRHLVARGYAPGPEFGEILERCLALQDATGSSDPDALLTRVLAAMRSEGAGQG